MTKRPKFILIGLKIKARKDLMSFSKFMLTVKVNLNQTKVLNKTNFTILFVFLFHSVDAEIRITVTLFMVESIPCVLSVPLCPRRNFTLVSILLAGETEQWRKSKVILLCVIIGSNSRFELSLNIKKEMCYLQRVFEPFQPT